MAFTKETKIDKIEIVGDYNHVQVRTLTVVKEDGVEISSKPHRYIITPGQDYSNEDPQVQAVCAAVHTTEIVEAFQNRPNLDPAGA